MKIGYHCSHEQFPPGELLKYAIEAEYAGFDSGLSSDHFHPWGEEQGHSGFAWAFLGAVLQATTLDFGVVCAPGQRYHPAILAQASATLAEMFPGRFWMAIGSGQLLNEGITGDKWPSKSQRNARLLECAEIIRALWNGETVSRYGYVNVEEAKLYSRPLKLPLLIGAAISPETAEWVGSWADGLITISQELEKMKAVVEAFRRGGGEGKPMFLKVQISYAKNDSEAALRAWEQWKMASFSNIVNTELKVPAQFDAAAEFITPADIHGMVRISSELGFHTDSLAMDIEMGFETLLLHNVNLEQERFIDDFGARVLSSLREMRAAEV